MDTTGHLFRNLPELTTPRLLLRTMSVDDAADLFEYASDPEVSRYLTWEPHRSIEESHHFLQGVVEAYAAGDPRSWAIMHAGDGKMIGTAGVLFWDQAARRSEIGYAMSWAYWGLGLMSEVVREVLRFGFEEMDLNRIEARCDARNSASAGVLRKWGFQHEGTLREQFVQHGELWDMLLFAILRREWLAAGQA